MTIGQRIAQKRKELGLSQEALGEQLGVSRQAIYKWESDAALPEIEKLIALSRIFSVSVGWLLGEEENSSASDPGELTEEQLRMVQEIVDRYLAARPAPEPVPQPRRRRRSWFIGAAALVLVLISLFFQLDSLNRQYSDLRYGQSVVQSLMERDIDSIAGQVEQILSLTAEYSAEIAEMDLTDNTVTFAVRAVPKTYRDGMTALFVARSGENAVEVPVEAGEDHAFSGEVTCPLTDDISLTVVFVTDGQWETQPLEQYAGLYTDSIPQVWPSLLWLWIADGVLPAGSHADVTLPAAGADIPIRFGLFRDQELVCWYEEDTGGEAASLSLGYTTQEDVVLEQGHVYCWAAVFTDEYGREWVSFTDCVQYDETLSRWYEVEHQTVSGPEGWKY